jgi:PAS domain S-box-containing protein
VNSLTLDLDTLAPEAAAHAFYEFSPHACFVLDPAGRVASINARGAEMLGYRPDELRGVDASTLIAASGRPVFLAQVAEALASPGRLVCGEFDRAGRAGRLFRVRQQLLAPPAADGLRCLLAVWMDVSEEHRARLALAQEQARVQALALESTLTEERERRRLSVALHDEIGQRLALARLALLRERSIGGGGQRTADALLALIDESIAVTRSLTNDLSSPVLYELGLEAAVRSLCDRTAASQHLAVGFGVDGRDRGLRECAVVLLHRAARELVHNAVKHASASRLDVRLVYGDSSVSLTVADDGRGCQPPCAGAATDGPGFGLLSLRQQLLPLGGRLRVHSQPGSGTRVEVVVPW